VTRAEQFRHDAFTDPLTGVSNRRGLDLIVQRMLEPGPVAKAGVFAMLEIGGLTDYNSRHGFQKTDELLRQCAEILAATGVQPDFACGRLNGGTFAALIIGADADAALAPVSRLCGQMQAAVEQSGSDGRVTLRVGAVQFDSLGQSFSRLLSAADLALARAGSGAGGVEIVRLEQTDADARGSGEWRRLIEQALEARQLSLFAQTVVGLPGREPLQVEINVRLQESAGLPVEARLFMPMALRHKLGPRLDATVFDLVIERLAAMPAGTDGIIALNVCGPSLRDAGFLAHVGAGLAAAPQLAKRLVFETSEAAFLENLDATPAFAARVRALGAQFALDNFLVSGESLKRLESLLPHYVKLSSRFTADLFNSAEARFLVSSLVRITQSLDIPVIAQGIEQEQSIDVLVRLSVSGVQGYVVGKPEPW
jgi:diguanylate cyclase (GGDEF)-like protein